MAEKPAWRAIVGVRTAQPSPADAADPIRQALVAGMLHFASSTGVEIIAEGVETEPERLALQGLGVSLGQGYLFGRPVKLQNRR